jgi:hypothetical protein
MEKDSLNIQLKDALLPKVNPKEEEMKQKIEDLELQLKSETKKLKELINQDLQTSQKLESLQSVHKNQQSSTTEVISKLQDDRMFLSLLLNL